MSTAELELDQQQQATLPLVHINDRSKWDGGPTGTALCGYPLTRRLEATVSCVVCLDLRAAAEEGTP